jgi:hypothetical protein
MREQVIQVVNAYLEPERRNDADGPLSLAQANVSGTVSNAQLRRTGNDAPGLGRLAIRPTIRLF